MKLAEALEYATEQHRAGELSEAARFYKAILEALPKHPVANHNMGALILATSKPQKALAYFRTALEANPKNDRYWLSYIRSLISLDRADDAKRVLDQARERGKKGKDFDELHKKIKLGISNYAGVPSREWDVRLPEADDFVIHKLNQILQVTEQRFISTAASEVELMVSDRWKGVKKNEKSTPKQVSLKAESIDPITKQNNPDKREVDALFRLYHKREWQKCLAEAVQLLEKFPKSIHLYNLIGATCSRLKNFDAALDCYHKALELEPNSANANFNIGITQMVKGDLDAANNSYERARKLQPKNAKVHYYLGRTHSKKGDLRAAINWYEKALEMNPEYPEAQYHLNTAQHFLAAETGKTPLTAPKVYVEGLFDNYASRFEQSLLEELAYQTPKIIAEKLAAMGSKGSLGSVLDLGCGTGLVGQEVRPLCEKLEGVDISKAMLKEAERKNVYDKLTRCGITEYLSNESLDYDYIVAADVFVYIGDLSDIFCLIKTRNKRSGKFVFSTEHTESEGFVLEKSGRFSHSKAYIEMLASKFEFQIAEHFVHNLRKEYGKFLVGGFYILDF